MLLRGQKHGFELYFLWRFLSFLVHEYRPVTVKEYYIRINKGIFNPLFEKGDPEKMTTFTNSIALQKMKLKV